MVFKMILEALTKMWCQEFMNLLSVTTKWHITIYSKWLWMFKLKWKMISKLWSNQFQYIMKIMKKSNIFSLQSCCTKWWKMLTRKKIKNLKNSKCPTTIRINKWILKKKKKKMLTLHQKIKKQRKVMKSLSSSNC
jgi:hypothetical protein